MIEFSLLTDELLSECSCLKQVLETVYILVFIFRSLQKGPYPFYKLVIPFQLV